MEPENQDVAEVHETTAEVAEETTQETPTLSAEEIEELKKKAEVSSQNFERAKKAEEDLKKLREKAATEQNGLSQQDVLVLAKADIHEDDLDEVIEFARFKKIPIKEALKNPTVKGILATKAEERKTAEVTLTRGGQRAASKVSGEDLLAKAERTGELPESEADLQALFKARQARRKQS